jgi:two-component system alkaline phosphatase synthesis response regulator PhoP
VNRILLVEDELRLGDTIKLSLEKMGFECVWVKTLKNAVQILKEQKFGVAVVDWNLPDGEGIELLRHPKRNSLMMMILSSKSSVEERVEGLKRGADDYLPKPFSFHELEARIRALLRRKPEFMKEDAASTGWSLNESTLQVSSPQGTRELTPLEFKFLNYLFERQGTIVSKDRLLRDVWGFSLLPKTRTVDYVITNLRKYFEPDPESPKHLLTIRGAGVKFIP